MAETPWVWKTKHDRVKHAPQTSTEPCSTVPFYNGTLIDAFIW